MLIRRGCQLECVPVPSAGPAFKELSGCLRGRASQKSISQSHKLFELRNVCCIIARRAMCAVCVCSRSCRGVVWVDCISAHLCLLLSLQHNLVMFHSASVKEGGQLRLDRSHRNPASLISPLAAEHRSSVGTLV